MNRILLIFLTLIFLLGVVGFSGCAITSKIPANRFDSPEAVGQGAEVLAGLEGGNEYVISLDDTANPPDLSDPYFQNSEVDPFVNMSVGLSGISPQLDFGLKIRTNTASEAQVKYQILGQPRTEASEGNFSVAITAGLGANLPTTTSSSSLFGSTTAENTMRESVIDFAAIAGYRFSPSMLLYGGLSWTRQTYSGTLTQTLSSGAEPSYYYSGQLRQTGFNLGIETALSQLVARVEVAAAWTTSSGNEQGYLGAYPGVELGVKF